MDEVKRINLTEFREAGYLQEVNRCFFHPLGLALEVKVDEKTKETTLVGVWDYRDDPEGITYGKGVIKQEKINTVENERLAHVEAREKLFNGSTIQQP